VYVVDGVFKNGRISNFSNEVNARAKFHPDPPTGLRVVENIHESRIKLQWTNFYPHKIQVFARTAGSDFDLDSPLANLSHKFSYYHFGVSPRETYYYALRGMDSTGLYSNLSEEVSATVPDLTPPDLIENVQLFNSPENDGQLVSSWNMSDDPYFDHYRIYLEVAALDDVTNLTPVEIITDRTQATWMANAYSHPGLLQNGAHYYVAIVAVDDLNRWINDSSQSSSGPVVWSYTDTISPDPIYGVNLTYDPETNGMVVTWDPSKAHDFAHYLIYLSNAALENVSNLDAMIIVFNQDAEDVSLTDWQYGFIEGGSYSAAVVAVDTSGNFDPNVSASQAGPVLWIDPSQSDASPSEIDEKEGDLGLFGSAIWDEWDDPKIMWSTIGTMLILLIAVFMLTRGRKEQELETADTEFQTSHGWTADSDDETTLYDWQEGDWTEDQSHQTWQEYTHVDHEGSEKNEFTNWDDHEYSRADW